MCPRHDSYPRLHLRSPSADSHDLALMAFEQPSPDDLEESVVLMRRWTRLPDNRKPEVDFRYRGIRSRSSLGFLVWLVGQHGNSVYMVLQEEHPVEAASFRHQLLTLCESQAACLLRSSTSGIAFVFSRALAHHAMELPRTALGKA
jgi:hypothetical protein